MRALILAGVLLAAVPAPAAACTSLPAPSATNVPIAVVKTSERTRRTALRVCVDGRKVQLARGTFTQGRRRSSGVRIGAASAAGNRVAWIAERHRDGLRRLVVTVAAVGRNVRVVRRLTAHTLRTRFSADLAVLLTREGDLAWTAGHYDEPRSGVRLSQPGKRTRWLTHEPSSGFALEDGHTLRWRELESGLGFFDLRPVDCRKRARFHPFAGNDRVLLTRALYGPYPYEGTTVVRGCDLAGGRDRVLVENVSNVAVLSELELVSLDGTAAVFSQNESDGETGGVSRVIEVDVITGRSRVTER